MSAQLKILFAEDQPTDVDLMVFELKRAGIDHVMVRVDTPESFLRSLEIFMPGIILSDFSMPHFDGFRALDIAREKAPDTPFIFVSGTIGEEAAIEALKRGAVDYVLKTNLMRLGPAVKRALHDVGETRARLAAELQLNEARVRFELFMRHLPGGAFIKDSHGRYQFVNYSWEEMTGKKMTDVLNRTDSELWPQYAAQYECHERKALDNEPSRSTTTFPQSDGVHHYLVQKFPIQDHGRNQVLVGGIAVDFTDRLRAEGKIARLNRIYSLLSGINSLIVRVRDRQELFNEACRIAVEFGKFGIAWIGQLDTKTLDITPVAWAGESAEVLIKIKSSARDATQAGQDTVGRAIRERHFIVNNDIVAHEVDGPRRQEILRLGFHSKISLPLFEGESVVGALTMLASEQDYFNEEELKLLNELARDISFALGHIGTGEKIARLSRIRALMSNINALIVRAGDRQELFNEACRIAVEHGGFGIAWIGTLDTSTEEITPVAWAGIDAATIVSSKRSVRSDRPTGRGAASRALREKKAVFCNDIANDRETGAGGRKEALARGYRSLIGLPLIVEGVAVGNFSLFAKEPDFFNEDELTLLAELADNISFALAHIAKEEKIARLSRIQAVMTNVNALIVRADNRQGLFDEACRIAVEHGKFGIAWIGSLDPKTLDVTPVAWGGQSAEKLTKIKSSARDDVVAGEGAVGRAIRARHLVFNNDIRARDFGGPRLQEILRLGFQSHITLPLFDGEAVAGTLTMYVSEPNFFNVDELKLLTELAANISFALQNITKEEKIARLNRIQAVMGGINALIVRARDAQELFDGVCRIAVEHGRFGTAWIGAFDAVSQISKPVAWAGGNAERLAVTGAIEPTDVANSNGVASRAIRTKQLVFENDLAADPLVQTMRRAEAIRDGLHSLIALPFIVEGSVVGHLSLYARETNFFNEEELRLLSGVAGDISFALTNIGNEEKITRLSRIQSVMSGINALIVRARDRQSLFEGACRIAMEQGHFGVAWIGTFDAQTLDVTPAASAGLEGKEELADYASSADINHPRGQGVIGQAIRERKPVFNNNIGTEKGAGRRRKERIRRGYRSRIALPLLNDGCIVAVMVLYAMELDFFTEDELTLLTEMAGDVSFALDHISKEDKLSYLAFYDELTGLPNRTLLLDYLGRVMRRAKEENSKVAVVMCDVNRFSHVNETLGREAGDSLLRELGQRLKKLWPEPDNLARLSEDRFGGIVADINDGSQLAHLIEEPLAKMLIEPFDVGGEKLRISITTGIAAYPSDGDDAGTLLKNAEAALKKAKISGEKYLFYHSKMNAAVTEMLLLENKLRGAIEKEQFVLHYQPKVNLVTGHISGLEALIRWNDPENGLIPPVKFIPLLEETGMIIEVGAWAIRKSLADYRAWQLQGIRPPRIAVNVSSIQLRQKDFVERVRNQIKDSKSTPHGLDLEITESLIMEDIEGNIEKLKSLRDMKVKIAIDDFGTGYSSLGYLARLPVDLLKIDRSFIITMTKNADSMAIVSTIISLGHSLNKKVIAEGVETEEQSRFLKLLKCDEMQGYLFSKPLPAPDITRMLEEHLQD